MPNIDLVKDKSVIVLTLGQDVPDEAEFILYKDRWFRRAEEQHATANQQWVEVERQNPETVAYVNGKDLMVTTNYLKHSDQVTNEAFR